MCCSNFWKKIVSFILTFVFGLFIVNVLQRETPTNKIQEIIEPVKKNIYQEGNGISGGGAKTILTKSSENQSSDPNTLRIISKPRANYTDEARQDHIQGTVTLRVTFLANGQIGNVSSINDLPGGLTEQAMAAAAQIKFNPATRNEKPVTVTKTVQYSFTIY